MNEQGKVHEWLTAAEHCDNASGKEYYLGQAAKAAGDWQKAAEIFEKQAKEAPELAIRHQLAGEALFELKNYKAAVPYLAACVGLAPKQVRAMYLLAMALQNIGEIRNA